MASLAYPVFSTTPLADGDVTAVRSFLIGRLAGLQTAEGGAPLRSRTKGLLHAVAPVLVWLRDHEAVRLDEATIHLSMQLRSSAELATRRIFLHQPPGASYVRGVPVPGMPETVIYPLNVYLDGLPGYDAERPFEGRGGDEVWRQHGMVLFMAQSCASALGAVS